MRKLAVAAVSALWLAGSAEAGVLYRFEVPPFTLGPAMGNQTIPGYSLSYLADGFVSADLQVPASGLEHCDQPRPELGACNGIAFDLGHTFVLAPVPAVIVAADVLQIAIGNGISYYYFAAGAFSTPGTKSPLGFGDSGAPVLTISEAVEPVPVPEPAPLAMLGLGIVGLAFRRARSR